MRSPKVFSWCDRWERMHCLGVFMGGDSVLTGYFESCQRFLRSNGCILSSLGERCHYKYTKLAWYFFCRELLKVFSNAMFFVVNFFGHLHCARYLLSPSTRHHHNFNVPPRCSFWNVKKRTESEMMKSLSLARGKQGLKRLCHCQIPWQPWQ